MLKILYIYLIVGVMICCKGTLLYIEKNDYYFSTIAKCYGSLLGMLGFTAIWPISLTYTLVKELKHK